MNVLTRVLLGLARPLQLLCGLLLLLCGAAALVWPHNSSFVFRAPLVWVATAAALLVWFLLHRRQTVAPGGRRFEVVGAVTLSALSAIIAALSRYEYSWDAKIVMSAAQQLADDKPLWPMHMTYFALYPNNLPLLSLDTMMCRLASALSVPVSAVVIALNVLCLFGTMTAVSASARRLGHPRGALALQVVTFLLIGSSPIMTVPYTDLPGCLATAVAVWCAVVWRTTTVQRTKVAAVVGAALALGTGAAFKPYVIVLLIALIVTGMVYLARFRRHRNARALLLVPLAVLVAGAGAGATNALGHAYTGLSSARLSGVGPAMPPLHFVQMGLHDTHDPSPTRTWGGYDRASVHEALRTKDAHRRDQLVKARLRHELHAQGAMGTASFLVNKVLWVWGDGTFWSQGEGTDRLAAPTSDNPVAEATLQKGHAFPVKAALTQGVWIALLLVTGAQLLRRRPTMATVWMATSVLGVSAYLMLFEGRPRYVLALLPALLVLTQLTIDPHRARGLETGERDPRPVTPSGEPHTGATLAG